MISVQSASVLGSHSHDPSPLSGILPPVWGKSYPINRIPNRNRRPRKTRTTPRRLLPRILQHLPPRPPYVLKLRDMLMLRPISKLTDHKPSHPRCLRRVHDILLLADRRDANNRHDGVGAAERGCQRRDGVRAETLHRDAFQKERGSCGF